MALNHGGVSASLFSDFGASHEILDATGEPTQTLAVSNIEVMEAKSSLLQISGVGDDEVVVVVTIAQADHGLDDGDFVTLDDMRGTLESWNGRQVSVRRVAIASPVSTCVQISHFDFFKYIKTTVRQSTV